METQNTVNADNANTTQASANAYTTPNAQNPYVAGNTANTQNSTTSFLSSFDNAQFVKGALIGAAVGYLLTNEKAQKTIMKTVAKGTEMFQMGIEEMKERFEDVKAEMASKN